MTGVAGMQIIRQSLQDSEILPDIVEVIRSPGETSHTNSTKCISTSGYSLVVKGHMTHCSPL